LSETVVDNFQHDSFMTKIEVRIKIPDELKPWLVDDWDLVTRQKQVCVAVPLVGCLTVVLPPPLC